MIINLHSLLAKFCLKNKKYFYFLLFLISNILFSQTTITFNTTGTGSWSVPCDVTSVTVEAWGGGGAGGGTSANNAFGGGGGGGGAYVSSTISVTQGSVINFSIGTGATGATSAGASGQDTWFVNNTTILAKGGFGGAAPNTGTSDGGATLPGSIGTTIILSSGVGGSATAAGAGGTSGGTGGGTGGAASPGGNGGDGGNGVSPGGGGGGAFVGNTTNRSGGSGGNGQIRITYTSLYNYCSKTISTIRPITNVNFVEINNTTPNTSTIANENFCLTANVLQGDSYTISLKGNSAGNNTDYYSVFIDWNKDGDFNDTGETYNIGTLTNTTGIDAAVLNGNIAVPSTATLGNTRMRIVKNVTEYSDACTAITNGQTEDYTINVLSPTPCSGTPTGGTATLSASTGSPSSTFTATVTGATNGSGLTYQWQSSPDNVTWTNISGATSASPTNITAVNTVTTTYYRRIINCSGLFAYSNVVSYTTDYCIPTFNTSNTGKLFIKSFKYIGVLNDDFLTTNLSTQSGTNGAYENYTTLTPIAEQMQGSVVNVEAVCGGNIRTPASGRWFAWVDWNKDGIFASTEAVYQMIAPYLTDAVTFGFQIPTNQAAGNYRLRVAVISGSSTTNTDPSCTQTAYYGEMEDYLFKVIEDNLAKLNTTQPNIFNRCEAGVLSLTAVKKDNNVVDFKWYDSKYGGNLLHTGATYSPNLTVSTTFYVTAIDINGKETPFRYPFFARIDPKPEVTFTPLPETICGDDDSFLILSVWGDKREEILIDEKFDIDLGEFENVKDVTDTFSDTRNTPAYSPDWRTNPENPIPHTPKNPPHLAIASSIASGYFGGNFAVINTDVYRNVSVKRHLASKKTYNTTDFLPNSLILDFEMYYFSIALAETDAYLKVEYSDNGGTWTSFATYNTNQGNPLIWKKISLNLDALGVPRSTNLKIRFSVFSRGFGATVAYYESIATLDNVKLYGFTPFGRDFDWSGLDNAVLYDDATCSIPLGNTLARKVCIKPSLDDFEKPYWDFSASATFLNGCPANNTTRVYNDTKIWNQPGKTNWTQTNDDWKPNGIPGIKNCVIVRTPVDLTSGSNGFARSVIVKPGGVLNIRSNSNLEVQNHVKNQTSAANFLIESDANLKQNNNTASNEGSITVKRNANLKRLDYNYWGTPVVGQNIKNFSPETIITRFYFYNEANDYFDGIFVSNRYPNGTSSLTPIQNANTYNFETAKGYAIRSSNNYTSALTIFEGNFVGIPNNGIKSYTLAYTDAEHGYNLISNPYPSNIDFDALYTNNSALISQTAYFWTNVNANPAMQANQYPKVGSINNYAVYSGTGGLSAPYGFNGTGTNTPVAATPNNIIKVGQGFIVKAKSAGNLSFRNSIRTKSPGTFFNRMSSTVAKDRYWLELKTPLNFVTPMLIGYVNGGTDKFDLDFDVPLLIQGADTFYSVLEDKKLAIQGRQFPLIQEDMVQLGAVFYDNGVHTISLANKEGIFANEQPIYLHDKQENVFVDLQKSSYTFQAVKGENKERFEIVYKDQFALATDDFEKQNVVVYSGQDSFTVIASDKILEIAMYDASGKLINKIKPNVTTGKIASSQLSKGVYVLKIKTTKNIITKKVIKN